MEYKKIVKNDITYHMINSDRFKTMNVVIFFTKKFDKSDIVYGNFLVNNLVYSSNKYNTKNKMAIAGEELFGAKVSASYGIFGKCSSFSFSLDFINPKYTDNKYLEPSLDFLKEILFNPNIKDDGFMVDYFNIIRNDAISAINSIKVSPNMYASIEYAKLMYKGTPSSYSSIPTLKDLNKVTPQNLYDFYKTLFGVSILNFPTKSHWRSPSKLSYIVSGLDWFCRNYQKYGVTSIAFPPLGCGNGGLTWEVVGPIMYSKLKDLPIEIEIYAPYGTDPIKLTENYLKNNVHYSFDDITGIQRAKMDKNLLLLIYVVQQLNNDQYSLSVGRTIFQKVCYVLTRAGVNTGFNFVRGSYGPYAKEVKDAVIVLSNANYITERRLGKMVEVVVSPSFKLDFSNYSTEDIANTNHAIDLLSRVKSTEHAEMITTILFSYDELNKKMKEVTDENIISYILSWKPRWKTDKLPIIKRTILNLSILGWIKPNLKSLRMSEDDLY